MFKGFRVFLIVMSVLNEITQALMDGVLSADEVMRILKRLVAGFGLAVDVERINIITGDLDQSYNLEKGCLVHIPQDILDQLKIDLTDQLDMPKLE